MSALEQTRRSISISDPFSHNTVACLNSATSASRCRRIDLWQSKFLKSSSVNTNECRLINPCSSESPSLTVKESERKHLQPRREKRGTRFTSCEQSLFIADVQTERRIASSLRRLLLQKTRRHSVWKHTGLTGGVRWCNESGVPEVNTSTCRREGSRPQTSGRLAASAEQLGIPLLLEEASAKSQMKYLLNLQM